MKYCYKCGNEVLDEAVVCPKCGVSLEAQSTAKKNEQNSKNVGLAIAMIVVGVTIAVISLLCLLSTL